MNTPQNHHEQPSQSWTLLHGSTITTMNTTPQTTSTNHTPTNNLMPHQNPNLKNQSLIKPILQRPIHRITRLHNQPLPITHPQIEIKQRKGKNKKFTNQTTPRKYHHPRKDPHNLLLMMLVLGPTFLNLLVPCRWDSPPPLKWNQQE